MSHAGNEMLRGPVPRCILITLLATFAASTATAAPRTDPRVPATFGTDGRAVLWVYFTDKGGMGTAAHSAALGRAERELTPAARARRLRATPETGVRVDGFDLPVDPNYLRAIERAGAAVRHASKWLNAASVETDERSLTAIKSLPFVHRIAPVLQTEMQDLPKPSSYGASLGQMTRINAVAAHDSGYSASGVIIGLLDTGFRKDHLGTIQLKRLAEWDFIQSDGETANQTGDSPDQWNHGTGVWSILGGYYVGSVIGPAYNASFVLAKTHDIRVSTKVDEDHWIAGAEWADSIGVDILQVSMVVNDPYSQLNGHTTPLALATNVLTAHGVLVAVAMGNTGPNNGTLWTPADCDSILAVGSTDQTNTISSFSSRGPTFDGRGKPDVVAQGFNTVWCDARGTTGIGSYPGTSLATPLVSGAAALVLEAHPEWSAQQIRYALKSTASHAGAPDSTTYGWGVPDVVKAIYQSTLGPPVYPKPFRLKLPANAAAVSGAGITFRWGRSADLTPGDAVTYSIQVKRAVTGMVAFATTTADTFVAAPTLTGGTAYEWNVTATDLTSHARPCAEHFQFTTTGVADEPPTVSAPTDVSGAEGSLITFTVSASDPDGDPLSSLTADFAALPAGNDAAFSSDPPYTSGSFSWHPASGDLGTYAVPFEVSNAMAGQATVEIHVLTVTSAQESTAPQAPSLMSRPNPFQSTTRIDAVLPASSKGKSWTLKVYDLGGRLVRTLFTAEPGPSATVRWNGETDSGSRAAAGVYYARIESGSIRINRRVVLLK